MTKEAILSFFKQLAKANSPITKKQLNAVIPVLNGAEKIDTNMRKGNFTEMLCDLNFVSYGATSLLKCPMLSLASSGHHGIDGIYRISINKATFYIVTDAKYNSARLIKTRTGRQLSDEWIDPRLVGKNTIRRTRLQCAVGIDLADKIVADIHSGKAILIRAVFHVNPDFKVSIHIVDKMGYICVRDVDL